MNSSNESGFYNVNFLDLQKNSEMLLLSEIHIENYRNSWLEFLSNPAKILHNYVTKAITINNKKKHSLNLSVFHSYITERFHEMTFELPRGAFVACLEHPDIKHSAIFVKDDWFRRFLEINFCCYGLIDEADFKNRYSKSQNMSEYVVKRRKGLEGIASRYSQVLFVIFSDSVLLKLPWKLNIYEDTYQPEVMISIFNEIRKFYQKILKCDCYGIFIQRINYSSSDELVSIGSSFNCIDLNTTGSAFANLFEIDLAIKNNLREKKHQKAPVYYDEKFLVSLKLVQVTKEKLYTNTYQYHSSINAQDDKYVVDIEALSLDLSLYSEKRLSFVKKIKKWIKLIKIKIIKNILT